MWRVGIDLGGTKIAGVMLDPDGTMSDELRRATPKDDYAGTIEAVAALVEDLIQQANTTYATTISEQTLRVGLGIPGSPAPATRRIQNANSTWLNGRHLEDDVAGRLNVPVRIANDANCFALSEATDGSAVGAETVLGVILGTGCGGGLVIHGRIIDGSRGTGGEWGHNPLPNPRDDERPGPACWCGRRGCLETWLSGPGLAADHAHRTGDDVSVQEIVRRAEAGDVGAIATLEAHTDRLARGLAGVINIVDPDVVVLGGGLSNLQTLYQTLPGKLAPHIFADARHVVVRPPRWGDASGVRGAARLWPSA